MPGARRLGMNSATKQRALMLMRCLIVFAAVAMPACRQSQQKGVVLEISAQTLWVDTGVDVTNKNVRIKYESGNWSNDGKESHFCDGEGFIPEPEDFRDLIPKLALSNAPLGSLIGKTNGEPFFVGNSYEGHPGDGTLHLSINDNPNSFGDNAGALRVVVTVLD